VINQDWRIFVRSSTQDESFVRAFLKGCRLKIFGCGFCGGQELATSHRSSHLGA
jgi:hypothetical protein